MPGTAGYNPRMSTHGKGAKGPAHARRAIAAQAARLIAEDGVAEFGAAKRKAARQLGFRESDGLPDNDEVEHALRAYQLLYQRDEQRERLCDLRSTALDVMRELQAFNPYLTGPAWNGTATRGAGIDISLFTDAQKQLEFELINRGVTFAVAERAHFNKALARLLPVLSFSHQDTEVHLIVYSLADERGALAADDRGRTARGGITEVELLIDADDSENTVDRFLSAIR